MQLPDSIVAELVAKLETLAKKYETTFAEVETQIEETEKSLSAMIDDLDGSESVSYTHLQHISEYLSYSRLL